MLRQLCETVPRRKAVTRRVLLLLGLALVLAAGCEEEEGVGRSADDVEELSKNGELTAVESGGYADLFEYDPLGRVVRARHRRDGAELVYESRYGYPIDGVPGAGSVLVERRYPDGEIVRTGYDVAGEVASVTAGATPILTRQSRNARGQVVEVEHGNGVLERRVYDEQGDLRLDELQATSPQAGIVQQLAYAYDAVGNPTSVQDAVHPERTATYAYDALDRLARWARGADERSYRYDALDNLIEKEGHTQLYGAPGPSGGVKPHALRRARGRDYAYDESGNTVRIDATDPTSGAAATTRLEWNADGMPVRVTRVEGGGVERLTERAYVGKSIWKKTAGGKTTYYLPGMHVTVPEGGTLAEGRVRKLYGSAQRDAEGNVFHVLGDHLGSTTVVTDALGFVVHRSVYTPWGEDDVGSCCAGSVCDTESEGCLFDPVLRYNQKEPDESGFYDYGARLYEPLTGRWLSGDPAFDGLDPYAYVRNNPVRYVDADGRVAIVPLLLKAGVNAAADLLAQVGMEVFFGGKSLDEVDVNWKSVGISSLEGLLPWKTPGGRLGRAALSGATSALTGYWNARGRYSDENAVRDFMIGFVSDLAGGGLGELTAKYGEKAVRAGLQRLGLEQLLDKGAKQAARGAVDPHTIRFSQNSIKRSFTNGATLREAIDGLKSGAVSPESFPPIRVFERNGQLFTLDNRRLYVFQEAGIPIRTVPATADEIRNEAWKLTTTNEGTSIVVRGAGQHYP
jgi:RHS repeat-associated protein